MVNRSFSGRVARGVWWLALGIAVLATPSIAEPASPPADIDLKLFEKSEVDRSRGCSVVLWQDDRDPEKDKYAYLFVENLAGKAHARQPARIKIGGAVTTMKRVATGGKTTGYDLYEYQVYQLPAANEFVILQLTLAEEEGEAVDVEAGKMTVIMKGKPAFRTSVKGNAGCNTPASTEAPVKSQALVKAEPPVLPAPPAKPQPAANAEPPPSSSAASLGGAGGGAYVAPPVAVWYGAIAYSPSTRALGWSNNQSSRQASENAALAGCRKYARDCVVPVWFKKGCGALAAGPNGYGTGWGAGRYIAERTALRECGRHTRSCAIRRWTCTSR
ncbi:MAG: hypothetical protein CTY20_04060 [Hyphomicrobium sp.]|nr:MAG: hypothetical protein CTY20_04060 [Hyphomicrobium sp.]